MLLRFPLCVLLAFGVFAPSAPGAAQDVPELVAKLKSARDSAETEWILELADLQTREALEGLLEVYDVMGSIHLRREIIRALGTFDGVPEAEQPALEKVMNVAVGAPEKELRDASIETLARSPNIGKHFLRLIVDSSAKLSVREDAMEAHFERVKPGDFEWYRELYKPTPPSDEEKVEREREKKRQKKEKKRKEREGKSQEEPKVGRISGPIRKFAFQGILSELSDEEVTQAVSDGYWEIRGLALLELEKRDLEACLEHAQETYDRLGERPIDNRLAAAGILARAQGTQIADEFIDMAGKQMTPPRLRTEMADLLAAMNDEKVNRKLVQKFGKGKQYQKLFSLRALRDYQDPKLTKKIIKLLRDPKPDIVVEACAVLASRGDVVAIPDLVKLFEKADDPYPRHAALQALAVLREDDPAWAEEILTFAANEDTVLRNLALRYMGDHYDPDYLETLAEALKHPQWSTRVAAIEGLEKTRSISVVPWIIDQMQHEEGRMEIAFAEVLWRLTGKPFERSQTRWKAWWDDEGELAELIDEDELEKLEEERELRRLREVSQVKSQFFGIEITSYRVLFVLDVSGSMNWRLESEIEGTPGEQRFAVAVRELRSAVKNLEEEALFNVLVFSSDHDEWLDSVVPASDENKAEAIQYINRLGIGGGTNIYDALKTAFEDLDIDTIFLLSDGEPEGGTKDDPTAIREDVARWNEQRKIVINTVAVGARLQILKWLAEDSGGSHVEYR